MQGQREACERRKHVPEGYLSAGSCCCLSAEVRGGREAARTGFLQVGGPAGGDTDLLLTCTPANRASIRFWRGVGAEEGQGIGGESVYVSTEEQIR
jgi:hypothetical protein